jgi:hypothetical protein
MWSSVAETEVASLKTTQIAAAKKKPGLLGDFILPPCGAHEDLSANVPKEQVAITVPSLETQKLQATRTFSSLGLTSAPKHRTVGFTLAIRSDSGTGVQREWGVCMGSE